MLGEIVTFFMFISVPLGALLFVGKTKRDTEKMLLKIHNN